ncbi:MAG: hypothetical protein NTV34_06700 [Proteobacteria bacterium]|nr:hypothetical protein [Pseudomonadota bacterium]
MRQLLISLIGPALAVSAVGAPGKILLTKSVEILKAGPNGVTLTTELDCGEKITGVLIKESMQHIGIALIIERPEVHCGATPKARTLTIPFVSTKFKEIIPLIADDSESKVTLQEVDVAASPQGLDLKWEYLCREPLGALLVPESMNRLAIAMVFKTSRKKSASSCEGGVRSTTLTSIDTVGKAWVPLLRPGKLEDIYTLHVRHPESIQTTALGEISLNWVKDCREIALGVLFTGTEHTTAAILTAYLPNVSCANPKQTQALAKVSGLSQWNSSHLKTMSKLDANLINLSAHRLQLTSSEKIEFTKISRRMQVIERRSCNLDIGVVVGNDDMGNLSVGSLKQNALGSCETKLTRSRAVMPLKVTSDLTPRIFPLKISGSLAH